MARSVLQCEGDWFIELGELREYAGHRGCQIVEEFTDQGVSGCQESRPALNRLMSDACRRRVDAVLVGKIRPLRTVFQTPGQCSDQLSALGVAFPSLRNYIDLSTPPAGDVHTDSRVI